LCGDLPKNPSHSTVDLQIAIGQLVDSVSEIGADWVIASQDCFGHLCNPVTSKYHSLQLLAGFKGGLRGGEGGRENRKGEEGVEGRKGKRRGKGRGRRRKV